MINPITTRYHVLPSSKASASRSSSNIQPSSKITLHKEDLLLINEVEMSFLVHPKLEDYSMLDEQRMFTIPQTEKDKFINDALYADERRLLQMVINTLDRTALGKSMHNVIFTLQRQGRIFFSPTEESLGASGKLCLPKHTPKGHFDVLIVIAKDNTIYNLAMTLAHEITHFLDFYNAKKTKTPVTRLDAEIQAFASSYRFIIEHCNGEPFGFAFLPRTSQKLLRLCYQQQYTEQKVSQSTLVDSLTDAGYVDLMDIMLPARL